MTFNFVDAWWWPFVFILVAGFAATEFWRFLGVFIGDRISEESSAMVLVRAVATALLAAVISNLIVFPGGALAATPLALRIGAAASGFAAYLLTKRTMVWGIVVAEIVLGIGLAFGAME